MSRRLACRLLLQGQSFSNSAVAGDHAAPLLSAFSSSLRHSASGEAGVLAPLARRQWFSTAPPGGGASRAPQQPASRLGPAGISASQSAAEGRVRTSGGAGASAAPLDALHDASAANLLQGQRAALDAIPLVPKALGFAGAIPFLGLSPWSVDALGYAHLVPQASTLQVGYAALIISFLGAVHWGAAMSTTLAGPTAALMLRQRFIWSVTPSLGALPLFLMQPGPAAFCASIYLLICYFTDRSYGASGQLPRWYLTQRGYLTCLAVLGCLSTAWWYLKQDIERAERRVTAAAAVTAGGTPAIGVPRG